MGTTPELIRNLIAESKNIETKPEITTGRGRPPLYAPMVQYIIDQHPQTVVFGPFQGVEGRIQAERVRTGCYSYAHDHPDMVPGGKVVRFSVRNDNGEHTMLGWLDNAPPAPVETPDS